MSNRGEIRPGRKQYYGWANTTWDKDGKWVSVGRRDMFDELMECESQEEFLEMAEEWLGDTDCSMRFIIMNLCLSYQSQKRESKYPWTFRDGDNNFDRYDDFTKKEDKN